MPHQTRMHQKITKKGMVLEALLRIILTVILLFIVFKVGTRVGSIFFGESLCQEDGRCAQPAG